MKLHAWTCGGLPMVVVDERDISKQEMMDGDLLNQEQWSR